MSQQLLKRRAATESALLGGVLIDHSAFGRVKDRLSIADFSSRFHQQVFRAMLDTNRAGRTIDTVALMAADPLLDPVKLAILESDVPTSANIEYYAGEIRKAAARQRVLDMAENLEFANDEFWNHTREMGANLAELEATPGLRVRSAADFATETPPTIQWIAEPLIVAGAITELSGKVKRGGKTTFLLDAVYHITHGLPWLGQATRTTRVVYLTEQPESSFREALRRARLLECRDMHVIFWADTSGSKWADVVRHARRLCHELEAGLLVVDTLGKFSGVTGDSENDAGAAGEAMAPLQLAAADGLGVVVSRHDRKGPGEVGESARGSSQYTGDCDIVLQIKRGEGNTRPTVRVLSCLSRFEIPETMVVEWTPDGFALLGSEEDLAAAQARDGILDLVGPDGALTEKEIMDALPSGVARTTARRELNKLVASKDLTQSGKGKRGDPYRYSRPGFVSDHIDNDLVTNETPVLLLPERETILTN